MPRIGTLFRLVCGLVPFVIGCVEAGSLDNKEEFESLLSADAAPFGSDAAVPPGGGSGGSGSSGRGGSGGGGMGAPATGCPEACDILQMRCATTGCHTGAQPQSGLNLNPDGVVARLSGMPATTMACSGDTLLDPDNPEDSVLYGKLLDPPSCGIRMPLGVPLDADEIDCMRRWVANPSCGAGNAGAGGMGGRGGAGGMGGTGGRGGMGGMGGMPATGASLWIEAEDAGTLTDPLQVGTDAMASGGSFISMPIPDPPLAMARPEPGSATDGIASYSFNVGMAGTYRIWGRVRIPGGENDSFWVRIDAGTWYQWNNIPLAANWTWDDVHDSNNMDMLQEFQLTAGQHTLNVAYREAGAELDKILITSDESLVPMGEGE